MTPTGADKDAIKGKHDDLTKQIIGIFFDVYNEVGSGFLESVYRECMRVALTQIGLNVLCEVPVPVHFRGELVGIFRADLIVNESVLVELKACDALIPEHAAQTMHYLRATNIEVALLMNFGPTPRFQRFIMDNHTKKNRLESVPSVLIGGKPLPEGEP